MKPFIARDSGRGYRIKDATDAVRLKLSTADSKYERHDMITSILGNIIENLDLPPDELLRMCDLYGFDVQTDTGDA